MTQTGRREFLAAAGSAMLASAAGAARQRPNILLLLDDQHRGMDLGFEGNMLLRTPNLDRLARTGTVFYNAIANCPVCTPSRAILLTGKYPLQNGTISNDLPLRTEHPTVASALRANGYRAGYIGKWHLDGVPRDRFTPPGPRRGGFDDFWAAYNCNHNYYETKYFLDTPDLVEREGFEPEIQTELAMDFIRKHSAEPFFLQVSWGPPHAPYQMVPDKYKQRYDPETLPLRSNCKNPQRANIAGYYAHIDALDEYTGRLMALLDELNLRDNTVIIFTSDHGDMLWSHGRVKKQQPWEESIRVPLIFNAPGLVRGNQRLDTLFGTADLPTTILGLAGIAAPAEMQGRDLSPRLAGEACEEHDSVPIMDVLPADQAQLWDGRPWRGVRTKRYTYARMRDRGWVLYDNLNDPLQMTNLIDYTGYRHIQSQLEEELQRWMYFMNDRFAPVEEILEELDLVETWAERQRDRGGTKWW